MLGHFCPAILGISEPYPHVLGLYLVFRCEQSLLSFIMINLLCPKHIVLNTKITKKYSANLWSKISFFPRSIWHAFDS